MCNRWKELATDGDERVGIHVSLLWNVFGVSCIYNSFILILLWHGGWGSNRPAVLIVTTMVNLYTRSRFSKTLHLCL